MNSDEVLARAMAYITARLNARGLKNRRNKTRCEEVEYTEAEDGFETQHGTPCWRAHKIIENMDGPDYEPIDPNDWCQKCNERQKLHEEYLVAAKKQGALYRKLEYAVLKITNAEDGDRNER